MRNLCNQFEEHLDALVGNRLPAALQQELRAHGAQCARCAALLAVVLDEPQLNEPTEDFVAPILQTTSGGSCNRSQALLCDFVDGNLSAFDASLLQSHLQHCRTCTGLQQALTFLRIDLPAMAMHPADADFVQDVLSATSMASPPTPGRLERWAETWNRMLQRPRFAWEVAWIGTAVLLLLVGSPRSPWQQVPQTALAIMQTNPLAVVRAAQPHAQRAWTWVEDDLDAAWDASGGRLLQSATATRTRWNDDHPLAVTSWQSLRERLTTLRQAVADGNLAQASYVINDLGGDIQNLWHGIRAAPENTKGSPTPPDREEN